MKPAYAERNLRIGPFEISTGDCTISRAESGGVDTSDSGHGSDSGEANRGIIKVSPRSMDVLIYLIEHPDRIVGSDELLNRFWSSVASDHAIHKAIAELRAAMGDSVRRQRYIKTIPRRGYKLTIAVASEAASPDAVTPGFLQRLQAHAAIRDVRKWAVAAAAGIALLTMLLLADVERQQHHGDRIVVGVAPFLHEGDGVETNRFLMDGLTTILINGLARLPQLDIVALPSVQDSGLPAANVDHVLEGTLLHAGDRIRVVVHLVRTRDGVHEYSGRFDLRSEDIFSVQDGIVSNIVSALAIHLDDEQRALMRDWGTHNALAYDRFMKGEFYNNQFNPADWEQAIEHHLEAISLDPSFVNAYLGVATAANNLSVHSRVQRKHELIALVAEMHRGVAAIDIDHPVLEAIRAIELRMAGNDHRLEESHLRKQILSGSPPQFAMAHYALLLIGARLYDEARQFLDKSAEVGPFEISPDEIWSYRVNIAPPAEAIALRKEQLQERPKHIGMLGTVARDLAITGQYNEAIPYLTRQRLADSEGVSAEYAHTIVDALRGDNFPGSEAYAESMAKGQDSFFTNGVLSFMHGDLEGGARFWRALAPVQRRWLINMAHLSETYFPAGLVASADYQELLEELDAGKSWQRTLMEGVMILQQVTGVPLSQAALEAYQQNRFMIRNNLWTESDWAIVDANKAHIRLLSDGDISDWSGAVSAGL